MAYKGQSSFRKPGFGHKPAYLSLFRSSSRLAVVPSSGKEVNTSASNETAGCWGCGVKDLNADWVQV